MTISALVLCVFFFTQVYAIGLTESSLRPQSSQLATRSSLADRLEYRLERSLSGVSGQLKPVVVTIDGMAGAGKTTTARKIAEALGARYISYGGCYKFLAWLALEAGIKVGPDMKEKDKKELISLAQNADFSRLIMPYQDGGKYFYADKDITPALFSDQLAKNGSFISQIPEVRRAIVAQLKTIVKKEKSQGHSVVLEGRVTGIEIAADADVKIFLTADLDVRARYRAMELIENRGLGAVYCELFKITEGSFKSILDKEGADALKGRIIEAVKENIQNRDQQDQEREYMPAIKIPGAVTIDSSDLTTEGVLQAAIDIISKTINSKIEELKVMNLRGQLLQGELINQAA